jgi:hypothetical protein
MIRHRGLVVRDARPCRAPHHEGLIDPHPEERPLGRVSKDAATELGDALALRQKADHGVGEGVRLFDIGNMRGVEDGQAGAGNLAADVFAGRDRGRHVMASGDHQRRVLDRG